MFILLICFNRLNIFLKIEIKGDTRLWYRILWNVFEGFVYIVTCKFISFYSGSEVGGRYLKSRTKEGIVISSSTLLDQWQGRLVYFDIKICCTIHLTIVKWPLHDQMTHFFKHVNEICFTLYQFQVIKLIDVC